MYAYVIVYVFVCNVLFLLCSYTFTFNVKCTPVVVYSVQLSNYTNHKFLELSSLQNTIKFTFSFIGENLQLFSIHNETKSHGHILRIYIFYFIFSLVLLFM